MTASFVISVAAGVVQLVAFVLYNIQIFRGTSKPNAIVWTLWAYLTLLDSSSYVAMSGDLVKSILPVASAVMTVATFLYALVCGKFTKPKEKWDFVAFAVGLVAGYVWYEYRSATYANLIVVCAIAVSFIPLYRELGKDRAIEKSLPWALWSTAYALSFVTVWLRWRGHYVDFAYSFVCFFLHLPVALIATGKSTK